MMMESISEIRNIGGRKQGLSPTSNFGGPPSLLPKSPPKSIADELGLRTPSLIGNTASLHAHGVEYDSNVQFDED